MERLFLSIKLEHTWNFHKCQLCPQLDSLCSNFGFFISSTHKRHSVRSNLERVGVGVDLDLVEAVLGPPVVALGAHILIVNRDKYVALNIPSIIIALLLNVPGLNLDYPRLSHFEVEDGGSHRALIELEDLAHGQLDRLKDITDHGDTIKVRVSLLNHLSLVSI